MYEGILCLSPKMVIQFAQGLWKPKSFEKTGEPRFQCVGIIPPASELTDEDKKLKNGILIAIDKSIKLVLGPDMGLKKVLSEPRKYAKFNIPLVSGKEMSQYDGISDDNSCLKMTSYSPPVIVYPDAETEVERLSREAFMAEVYSGRSIRAGVTIKPYNFQGMSKGISCFIDAIHLSSHGKKLSALGGRSKKMFTPETIDENDSATAASIVDDEEETEGTETTEGLDESSEEEIEGLL